MSTYLGAKKANQPLLLEDLRGYFQSFSKPRERHEIGVEWELFGVKPRSGGPLPYFGPKGIEAVLLTLADTFAYQPLREGKHVIGLVKGENYVALEPGGQLELSAGPVRNVHEIQKQLASFRQELLEVGQKLKIAWITAGFHPFADLREIEWVPKRRYEIMREYLAGRGSRAHDMMKRTAANQVSVDFSDEADAMRKLRTIYGITSLVSAMFAHSAFSDGTPNGFLSYRMSVWRETDPERTGLVPAIFDPHADFGDYLDYVLDAPMIFLVRGDSWIPMEGVPFRRFLEQGWQGYRATCDDFELHLSTLFPEARLKNCIEIRGADGQAFGLIPAVAAFWKGILYREEACSAAWEMVQHVSFEERLEFHRQAEKIGPKAHLGRHEGWVLLQQLAAIAAAGLAGQGEDHEQDCDERIYLAPLLEDILRPKKTPAEALLVKWSRCKAEGGSGLTRLLSL